MSLSRISFQIIGEKPEPIPCVFKIKLGKMFFIWKGPDIVITLKSLSHDLDRKVFGNCKEGDLFCKMAAYMRRWKLYELKVYPLFLTENVNKLIEFEAAELLKAASDPTCLNSVFEPYQTKWVKESLNKAISVTKPQSKGIVHEQPKSSAVSDKNTKKESNYEIPPNLKSTAELLDRKSVDTLRDLPAKNDSVKQFTPPSDDEEMPDIDDILNLKKK